MPAIVLASAPAFLTLAYIWASDRCQARYCARGRLHWASTALLPISQKMGWMIVAMLTTVGILLLV